jgi:hypothetical protein
VGLRNEADMAEAKAPPGSATESCGSCRAFLLAEIVMGDGFCRRHPPSLLIPVMIQTDGSPVQRLKALQPSVLVTDWCMEYQKLTPTQVTPRPV